MKNYEKSEAYFRQMIDSLPMGYCLVAINHDSPGDSELIEYNPRMEIFLNNHKDSRRFSEAFPGGDRLIEMILDEKMTDRPVREIDDFESGEDNFFNIKIRQNPDNTALIFVSPVEGTLAGGDGNTEYCKKYCEKIYAERALRRKTGELELLLNNIKTQIWFMRSTDTCGQANMAYARFFNLDPESLENIKLAEYMEESEAARCIRANEYIWKNKVAYSKEEIVTNGRGERRQLVLNKIPKLDSKGQVEYIICSAEDITELKQKQEEMKQIIVALKLSNDITEQRSREILQLNRKLEQSEAQLRELNANKDKFFSIIAHDLKNPFQGFLGLSKMMLRDIANDAPREELVELTNAMHTSAQHLFKLLENLLQWSRLQRGVVEFNPEDYPLKDVIFSNIDIYTNNLNEKGVALETAVADGVYVNVDINMVNTVIRNLLSNAIKFTPSGGRVKIFTEEYNTDYILVGVQDSGVGIDKENLSKLFMISEGYTTEGTRGEQGTGLGLILCRELIERHHASIWAESARGEGSTFYFTLPLAPLGNYSLGKEIA